jgi:hypothetical protein
MKNCLLSFALLTLTLSGCGGDSGMSPQSDSDAPLAVDTIGTAGGTFAVDDFELCVPPGAFSSDAELALHLPDKDHGLGDNCVSRFFRLEGLPATFVDTLTLRIGYDGALSGSTYVMMGEEVTFYDEYFEPFEDFLYSFHLATEAAGYLEARIPPQQAAMRGGVPIDETSGGEYVAAATGLQLQEPSAHFKIRYPSEVSGHINEIVSYFETAHDTVVSVGMGFQGRSWEWPAKVHIADFGIGGATRHIVSDKGLCMGIRTSEIAEDRLPNTRRLIGNLMVRSAQCIPSEREYFDDNNIPWNVAVRCYMQEFWAEPAGFTRPTGFAGNESFALNGLPLYASLSTAINHGLGWAPVVKHLVGLYGKKLIGDTYKITQATTRIPADALLEKIPDPVYDWWPQFVGKYVTGQYYGAESAVLLLNIPATDRYTIDSATDTLKVFSHETAQVSARMYRIILDYALIDENAILELSLSSSEVFEGYTTLLVYRTKDGSMELVGSGTSVTVAGLKDLTISGYDIVPVEVISHSDEPYYETVSTELRCRVAQPPPYNRAYIILDPVSIHVEDSYGNEWWITNQVGYWEGIGTWNGSVFQASWTDRELPGEGTASGSLTIVTDPVTHAVLSFRAAETRLLPTGFAFVDSIVGHSVAFDYDTGTSWVCEVGGEGACSSISTYAYKRSHGGMGTWIESDAFDCQGTTSLHISFWHDSGE